MTCAWKLGTYLAVVGAAAAGSFWLSDRPGAAVRLGVAAVGIATLVGAVVVRRPARQAGWWLVALSGCLTYGVAVATVALFGVGAAQRVATVTQVVLGVAGLLALAAGLAVLSRQDASRPRWDTLDTWIIAAGVFLLSWVLLIDPRLGRSASDFATAVAIAVPAASLLVFAMAVRLALGGAWSNRSGQLLLLATSALLSGAGVVADPIGATAVPVRLPILAAWLAYLILLGAVGIAPGFTTAMRGRPPSEGAELPLARLVLFVLLALVDPLNIAIGFSRAGASGTALAAMVVPPLCGTLIFLFLVTRLALLAQVARRRAEELGERSASLAQALARQRELHGQLAYRATHDPLTGLANRDVLTDRMERLRDACEGTDNLSCGGQALVIVDLDGFKDVNDRHGHPAGDQLLVEVAQRLVSAMPDEAVVARLGGDEFAVLLANSPANESRRAADEIRQALRTSYVVDGHDVSLSASLGVRITEPGSDPPGSAEGLRDADHALYDAKAAGGDRVIEFRPRTAR